MSTYSNDSLFFQQDGFGKYPDNISAIRIWMALEVFTAASPQAQSYFPAGENVWSIGPEEIRRDGVYFFTLGIG